VRSFCSSYDELRRKGAPTNGETRWKRSEKQVERERLYGNRSRLQEKGWSLVENKDGDQYLA